MGAATSPSGFGRAADRGSADLFDGRLKIPPDKGKVQLVLLSDRDMPNRLARTLQNSFGIGKQRASVETQVHVIAIGHDVAKAILERFAGERESNRNCLTFGDRFNRVGRLLENYLA